MPVRTGRGRSGWPGSWTEAGYTVELDVWDWAAGRNFVTAMSDALDRCDRVVALFSAAYFDRSRYTTEEWSAAVVHVPGIEEDRLVPVRVEEVPAAEMPAVLRPLVFRDLFGVAEEQARRVLLEAVAGPRRPDRQPVFPGRGTPGRLEQAGGPGPRLPGRCRGCGTSRRVIRGSPAGTVCWWRCGSGCWPGTRRWCRRCTGWAGWARPSWRPSTRTGSPGPMTWPGGSTPSRPG